MPLDTHPKRHPSHTAAPKNNPRHTFGFSPSSADSDPFRLF